MLRHSIRSNGKMQHRKGKPCLVKCTFFTYLNYGLGYCAIHKERGMFGASQPILLRMLLKMSRSFHMVYLGLLYHSIMNAIYHNGHPLTIWPYWQFDSRAGATWHCIVGRNFGSFVTHGTLSSCYCQPLENPRIEISRTSAVIRQSIAVRPKKSDPSLIPWTETKHFIYFYLGHYAILLFKTQ